MIPRPPALPRHRATTPPGQILARGDGPAAGRSPRHHAAALDEPSDESRLLGCRAPACGTAFAKRVVLEEGRRGILLFLSGGRRWRLVAGGLGLFLKDLEVWLQEHEPVCGLRSHLPGQGGHPLGVLCGGGLQIGKELGAECDGDRTPPAVQPKLLPAILNGRDPCRELVDLDGDLEFAGRGHGARPILFAHRPCGRQT